MKKTRLIQAGRLYLGLLLRLLRVLQTLCVQSGAPRGISFGIRAAGPGPVGFQSAWRRRKAGISKSSMPPEDSASTLAAAIVRLVRHTLGTAMPS